jgi:hypothetical protein
MNIQSIDKKRKKKKKERIDTVSDIFDYVFNEGEYRVINNTKERLNLSIISLTKK